MAGKSTRDKCFGDAVDAYNDAHPDDDLSVETQKPWVRDNGTWRPAGMLERIWNWVKGGEPYRVPDWTVTIDGRPVAGDNKFDGDGFGNRVGRSGKTQLQDQNDMNEHQNPGKKEYQNLSLDSEKCPCDDDPQPLEVYDPMLAPSVMPMPEGAPLPGGMPAVEPAPIFEPVFVP